MATSTATRVLHVYAGNLYGGVETFLRTLAEERGRCPEMIPEFALCFEGRIADEIRASGAPLHMLGAVRLSRPWTVLAARRRLAKVLRTARPDIVVCHAAWPYAIFAPVVKRARGRLVFYRHDIGDPHDWMNLLASRVHPDLVIANSGYTATHAYPKFPTTTQKIVYPVVRVPATKPTVDERKTVRAELGAADSDIVILQVSRMQKMKGQMLLLEALEFLPTTIPWKCWVVGNAQREQEETHLARLEAKARSASLRGRVTFLGPRSDIFALMCSADIFCQPNLSPESFGIVFVEALAAGLPIVTTEQAGGALEIVEGSTRQSSAPIAGELAALLRRVSEEATKQNGDLREQSVARAAPFIDVKLRLRELDRALRAGSDQQAPVDHVTSAAGSS